MSPISSKKSVHSTLARSSFSFSVGSGECSFFVTNSSNSSKSFGIAAQLIATTHLAVPYFMNGFRNQLFPRSSGPLDENRSVEGPTSSISFFSRTAWSELPTILSIALTVKILCHYTSVKLSINCQNNMIRHRTPMQFYVNLCVIKESYSDKLY